MADPELIARAERLRQKEQELNRREDMLDQRTQILIDREKGLNGPRKANWPKCKPLVYHDIKEDFVTPEAQKLMKFAYGSWIAFTTMLFYNTFALCAVLAVDSSGQAIGDFVLSMVFVLFLSPVSFVIYRSLYRGIRKNAMGRVLIFLIFNFIELLVRAFFAIGVGGTGAGGFVLMIKLKDETVVLFILLIAAIGWSILTVYSIWLWFYVRLIYKRNDGINRTKQEMSSAAIDAARNNPELFASAAKAGVQVASENPDLFVKAAKQTV